MSKPKIIILADRKGWVYSSIAKEIMRLLSHKYRFKLFHTDEEAPDLHVIKYDLVYVFFWGNEYISNFNIPAHKVIREVASYRWRDEQRSDSLTTEGFCKRYLNDCNYVTTPCAAIATELKEYRNRVVHLPNGVDTTKYRVNKKRSGELRIGWAGNPSDAIKGLHDVLMPAVEGLYDFRFTNGNLSRDEMVRFYNEVDVIAISSYSEGQPMPLIEAMACGCFPVTTDVGIVPELVQDGVNGLVVPRKSAEFRRAFNWCEHNIEYVRSAGESNSRKIIEERDWSKMIGAFDTLFMEALKESNHNTQYNFKKSDHMTINIPPEPGRNMITDSYLNHLSKIQCSYDENYESVKQGLYNELYQVLPVNKNTAILEIGGGLGYLINMLIDLGYENVICADDSKNLIDFVESKFGDKLRGAYWCDGADIVASNPNTFDMIILYDVIEHIPVHKMEKFVEDLKKSLRDGGKVIVRTPNMALPLSTYSRYIDYTHKIGFTEFSIEQLFNAAGFTSLKILRQDVGGRWASRQAFRIYRYALRKLYKLEGRSMPSCFYKNLLVEIRK
jgi:glycosyltransferase involved in cell wall biosynthesis/SAM-dependent methyltransferase